VLTVQCSVEGVPDENGSEKRTMGRLRQAILEGFQKRSRKSTLDGQGIFPNLCEFDRRLRVVLNGLENIRHTNKNVRTKVQSVPLKGRMPSGYCGR